jgi:hypothetical protein
VKKQVTVVSEKKTIVDAFCEKGSFKIYRKFAAIFKC